MLKYSAMQDQDFLLDLDHYKHNFFWTKIIALNWQEEPVEEITGKVTSGTINIDGKSSVRRTCSLNLVAEDVNINDFYWGLNTKFQVLIGLENHINSNYPDIIWFNQGIFLISSFKTSLTTNNYTISISGKDKMCLLNGEIGGAVPASWDFGKWDDAFTGEQQFYPIKQIIIQAVHEFAQEPWQNIIVNDLDDYGLELLEYQGENPLYYIINLKGSGVNDSREVYQITDKGSLSCWVRKDSFSTKEDERIEGNEWQLTTIGEIETDTNLSYEKLLEKLDPGLSAITDSTEYLRAIISLTDPATSGDNLELYTVAKMSRDLGTQVCGYRVCDIVYPYDLIASPGEAITSILDKLVQMLGNFEYFYNEDGQFIFQRKRTYLDINFNNIINEHDNSINKQIWTSPSELTSKYSYIFDGDELISAISNTPNLANLKNDFSIWADRKSGNITVPIHMRYAIDKKPYFYKAIGNEILRDENGFAYINIEKTVETENEDGSKTSETVLEKIYLEYYDVENDIFKKVGDSEINKAAAPDDANYHYNFQYTNAGICYMTQDYYDELFPELNLSSDDKRNVLEENYKICSDDYIRNNYKIVDWREILYQMANDYRAHYREEDFFQKIRDNNIIRWSNKSSTYLFPKGFTGYEKYYVDFEMNLGNGVLAYWRELYNPEAINTEGNDIIGFYENKKFYNVDDIQDFDWEGSYEPYSLAKIQDGDQYKVYRFRYKPSEQEDVEADPLVETYIAEDIDRADELKSLKNLLEQHFRQKIEVTKNKKEIQASIDAIAEAKNQAAAENQDISGYEAQEDILEKEKLLAIEEEEINAQKTILNENLDRLLSVATTYINLVDEENKDPIVDNDDINDFLERMSDFFEEIKNDYFQQDESSARWIKFLTSKYEETKTFYIQQVLNEEKEDDSSEEIKESFNRAIEYYKRLSDEEETLSDEEKKELTALAENEVDSINKLIDDNPQLKYDWDISVKEEYFNQIQKEIDWLEKKAIAQALNDETYWVRVYPEYWVFNSRGWNKDILNSPEILNFWFDFIDTTGELNKYAVQNIGQRSKVEKDDKIKAIYFREIPNVIFTTEKNEEVNTRWIKPGYVHVNIPKTIADWFTLSTRGKNMIDKLEELLYNYTFATSSISLTTVPIMHLTPNTLIYVKNPQIGAVGEYELEKYSIQLGLTSQMTLTAIETAKRLY